MDRIHLDVSGIENTEMKTSLKNALEKIDGVQMVNIDMGRGTVEVGFNEATDETEITDCIEHTGFKLGVVQ